MSFNAEGLTYPDACALMDRLRSDGIECAVTVGGVRVYLSGSQFQAAKQNGSILFIYGLSYGQIREARGAGI